MKKMTRTVHNSSNTTTTTRSTSNSTTTKTPRMTATSAAVSVNKNYGGGRGMSGRSRRALSDIANKVDCPSSSTNNSKKSNDSKKGSRRSGRNSRNSSRQQSNRSDGNYDSKNAGGIDRNEDLNEENSLSNGEYEKSPESIPPVRVSLEFDVLSIR